MARWLFHELKTAPMAPQSCSCTSCGKSLPLFLANDAFVGFDESAQPLGRNLRVGLDARFVAQREELVLEVIFVDLEDDAGVHLDEAAVGVEREAFVVRRLGQALHGLVVQAEVEDRVHHARHRGAGAGADGDEERLSRSPNLRPTDFSTRARFSATAFFSSGG